MKQDMRLRLHRRSFWSKFLDWNPQLFREIRGKLKTRNVVIAAAISVIIQFLKVISLLGQLPDPSKTGDQYGRYGTGMVFDKFGDRFYYARSTQGEWLVNWQLFWLDLFVFLSIVGIFSLLVVGTYLLIADMIKEEDRGTLNFIRQTPQPADSILLGKILGVPILLYSAILFLLPLHFVSAWQAHIPLGLTLGFYGVIIAGCACFYCLALFWSLIDFGASGIKQWLGSGLFAMFLYIITNALFHTGNFFVENALDWVFLFHPGLALAYLIDAANLPPAHKISFLPVDQLQQLSFYGQTLWTRANIGMALILFNFSLWTYWLWSMLQRRFRNPEGTLISKVHSYWLTAWFLFPSLGFSLQRIDSNNVVNYPRFAKHISNNLGLLQVFFGIFALVLIVALSPQRQNLFDWARYRHQVTKNNLLKELIFGEQSPSTIAVAINLLIAIAFVTPSILILLAPEQRYVLWGFILSASNIMLCAVIVQLMLMMKTRNRAVWTLATIVSLCILPPLFLDIADISVRATPEAWLFSFVPNLAAKHASLSAITLAIAGQWLAISVIGLQMTRKLKQAGASETRILTNVRN